MDIVPFWKVILGYVTSCILGHFFTAWAVNSLWKSAGVDEDPKLRPSKSIRFWNGVAERGIYTSATVLGKPEGIAVWLAFKALMRWRIDEKDKRHIPGSSIYMIGTAMNIAFGVLGGFIALGRWSF
jgi:hypothetical protein